MLQSCTYDTEVQYQVMESFVEELFQRFGLEDSPGRELEQTFIEEFSKLAPVLKNPAFAEEREWRIVSRSLKETTLASFFARVDQRWCRGSD